MTYVDDEPSVFSEDIGAAEMAQAKWDEMIQYSSNVKEMLD